MLPPKAPTCSPHSSDRDVASRAQSSKSAVLWRFLLRKPMIAKFGAPGKRSRPGRKHAIHELLPTRYVHVVLTLPHELAPLALQNKRVIYNLLFRISAEMLIQISRNPQHLRGVQTSASSACCTPGIKSSSIIGTSIVWFRQAAYLLFTLAGSVLHTSSFWPGCCRPVSCESGTSAFSARAIGPAAQRGSNFWTKALKQNRGE